MRTVSASDQAKADSGHRSLSASPSHVSRYFSIPTYRVLTYCKFTAKVVCESNAEAVIKSINLP